MNAAEIKLDLFRKLDALKGSSLQEAYGTLLNLINSKNDSSDWDNLTQEQQEGIQLGIIQLDNGEGISHTDVMTAIKKKYLNG